jgi:hypothetical protein
VIALSEVDLCLPVNLNLEDVMTSNNSLKTVDHLFLLVGQNPLPNYVAARTLLTEGGTVYLVFTKQTDDQKNNLKGQDGLLRLGIRCEEVDLDDDESNGFIIRDKIKNRVNSITDGGTVGLNYTGGTKAMAVHAYRAIQEAKPDAIFSYLDPRRLKMWIHEGDQKPIDYDISLEPKLTLKELFNLHGKYLLTNFPPRPEPYSPELEAEIAKLYINKEINNDSKLNFENWKKWCNKLPKLDSGIDLQNISSNLANLLSQHWDLSGNKAQITDRAKTAGFQELEELKPYCDGTWLESYVLKTLEDISDEIGLEPEDFQMSFNVVDDPSKLTTKNKIKDGKFELDVAFIKGYQLFAISCAAKSGKSDCKEKMFEGYLRAKELGGDEARVALVCCSDKPEEIEEDMKRFGTRDPKIKVFGRSHLANLADEIANWIDEVEQEANA